MCNGDNFMNKDLKNFDRLEKHKRLVVHQRFFFIEVYYFILFIFCFTRRCLLQKLLLSKSSQ